MIPYVSIILDLVNYSLRTPTLNYHAMGSVSMTDNYNKIYLNHYEFIGTYTIV